MKANVPILAGAHFVNGLRWLAFLAVCSLGLLADQIHDAARIGDVAKVRQLLEMDPRRVHARLPDGSTPLHEAAYSGQIDVARVLLKAGADSQTPNKPGLTPQQIARARGYEELALVLNPPSVRGETQNPLPSDVEQPRTDAPRVRDDPPDRPAGGQRTEPGKGRQLDAAPRPGSGSSGTSQTNYFFVPSIRDLDEDRPQPTTQRATFPRRRYPLGTGQSMIIVENRLNHSLGLGIFTNPIQPGEYYGFGVVANVPRGSVQVVMVPNGNYEVFFIGHHPQMHNVLWHDPSIHSLRFVPGYPKMMLVYSISSDNQSSGAANALSPFIPKNRF